MPIAKEILDMLEIGRKPIGHKPSQGPLAWHADVLTTELMGL